MAVLQEYKCPCCGGAIAFDSTLQKLKCPYCDTEFEMDTLVGLDEQIQEQLVEDMSWEEAEGAQWQNGEEDGLCSYLCKSCGGEIVGDENMAATSCPFCGNPVILTGKLSGSLKPDYVIPFKISKKAAKEALQKHYGNKKLLPAVFKDQNHLDEIRGIYVPYWLFDAQAEASARYKASTVRSWSDSACHYTETSMYSVTRKGTLGFEHVPVDGSTKIGNELMESIEPFDFGEAVDFQTAYLAGYLADKYDIDSQQSMERANERIRNSTKKAFADTVKGYTTVTAESVSVRLKNGKICYVLYPVWLLNTSWNGEKYTFAMNGQTGKFVGDLPLDKVAYRKWLFSLTGIIGVAIFGLSSLIWLL